MPTTFVRRVELPVPAEEALAWHGREGALERLTPPWESVAIEARSGGIAPGGRVELVTRLGPLRQRWVAEHVEPGEPLAFRDVQRSGPFRSWDHLHRFLPGPAGASTLEDRVQYELPLGGLGQVFGGAFARRRIERLFAYRHRVLADDLARHAGTRRALRIAVSGASGLVGSALVPFLTSGGHEVLRLVRREARELDEVRWSAEGEARVDREALEGLDAFVHLAGENIAAGRWSPERKARIESSRVEGTRRLAEVLAGLERQPSVLVCASAIGFYGERGEEQLDETSARGQGFLPEVCERWERAADAARAAGIRVVHARTGVVLSPRGGALARMMTPFKLGLGGPLGHGRQWMSWIALDDLIGVLHRALLDERLVGPVNAVAPEPVSNRDFGRALGHALRRPAFAPFPAFAARAAFGELADALLLASTRVHPRRLTETDFRFTYPTLERALAHLLGRPAVPSVRRGA